MQNELLSVLVSVLLYYIALVLNMKQLMNNSLEINIVAICSPIGIICQDEVEKLCKL